MYVARDLAMAAAAWKLATYIDPYTMHSVVRGTIGVVPSLVLRWTCWAVYWWYQGLIFSGLWVIGHECGHGALSESTFVCNVIGYMAHTVLWTPYFSWRVTHYRHHTHTGSMERDDAYRPKTLSEIVAEEHQHGGLDWDELLGDTPAFMLAMLIFRQLVAYPVHMLYHVVGAHRFPKWITNYDATFVRNQTKAVLLSNIGIFAMAYLTWRACQVFGVGAVVKYYGVPWMFVSHWFIMITYLHHTDPVVPRYRNGTWTYARGMASTIDRDFLGAPGKFFLHGIAHYHVVHHFFPRMPFYHIEEATEYLKDFIGPDHYHFSSTPVFQAMWETYNRCRFVDDTGDVLFYRDAHGKIACQDDSVTAPPTKVS